MNEKRNTLDEDIPSELRRPGGPTDYDESGGTGLEENPEEALLGGGVSGDDDPIGEPGIPDEASSDPEALE